MTRFPPVRAAIVALISITVLTAAPLGYAQSGGHAAAPGHQHGASCSAGAPTVTTCSAGGGTDTSMSGMGMGMSSGTGGGIHPMMEMERFDLVFIDMMIAHHESAIAMAGAMLQDGTDPGLLDLAQDIVDTQPSEITRMQQWRDRWYPNAPAFVMTPDMHGMMQGMDEMGDLYMMGMMDASAQPDDLTAAPEEMDLAFANAMIVHHQGAHMLMEMAVLHAGHPELAGFAGTMLETHHEQIMAMQDWQLD